MNKMLMLLLSLLVLMVSCASEKSSNLNSDGFSNPVLAGFYPDPSICRVGGDYYLVNSTFAYFPGIPVFHSRDMVSWKLIGHVMDRTEQLNLEGLGVSRGIFAPAISYHNGVYYVTCTLVDGGGNFVVTATDPVGPWSNPVWLPQINGIDPSLFFDKNGKTYILYNSVAPDDNALYEGHRTIRMTSFDTETLQMAGEEIILINGGTDLSQKPIWIEGPHIIQKDGWYYLIAAEGGTADQHSEVVFMSKEVSGPYVSYEKNPILTQRHLDPKRENAITSTGHADFVMTESGDWWTVFLGCRPYRPCEDGFYNTGRETFLAPVKWIDGWPVVDPEHEEVQYSYPFPIRPVTDAGADIPYSGNFRIRDEFDTETLARDWMFLRTPLEKWYDLSSRKGFLSMRVQPETCAGTGNPSFLGRRQQHLRGSASVLMEFVPESEKEKAGLLIFQNETHFYFLCQSSVADEAVIQLYKSKGIEDFDPPMELIASHKLAVDRLEKGLYLKIAVDEDRYSFYYGFKPDDWQLLKDNVDGRFLSTKVAGGFVGCVYAMYTTSLGDTSDNVAYFDWFEYLGDDKYTSDF